MKRFQSFTEVYNVNSSPVFYIETIEEAKVISKVLLESKIKEFAIDQERAPYNKFYFQQPCLVQIATEKFIVFIDLLSDEDILEPLKPIFENPLVKKVFFDAPWDLYYFQTHMDIKFNSVLDIQVISSLLSPSQGTASLINLVKEEFDVNIVKPKSQQKSDWTKRPLSAKQIRYASHEILWFLPIYKSLYQKLKTKSLVPFFDYGTSRLSIDIPNLEYTPMNVRRINGYSDLSNQQQHRLVQIGISRDQIAQSRNKPSFFILDNNQLLQLAQKKTIESVLTSRQKLNKKEKSELNRIVQLSYPDTPLENETTHFYEQPPLKQHLLTWRFAATKKFGLPKRFIISNNHIDSFDDSVFITKESLFQALWFTSEGSSLCEELTDDFEEFLRTVEAN